MHSNMKNKRRCVATNGLESSDKLFDKDSRFMEQMNQMFESNVKKTMERMEQKLSKQITE